MKNEETRNEHQLIEKNILTSLFDRGRITPQSIEQAEAVMLDLEQAECPVIHRFGAGIYIREVSIKAGVFAIGHYQRFHQMNLFLQGRVTVFEEDGSSKELVAPMCFVGEPGRKIGYVTEDMVWLNIYPTNETDIGKLEDMFLDKSQTWQAMQTVNKQALLPHSASEDHLDFSSAIAELGYTQEEVRAQSENTSDCIPMPPGNYKVKIGTSGIEGKGVMATADIDASEIIAPSRLDGMRTPVGRYTNHAKHPNAEMVFSPVNGNCLLVAIKKIRGCRGGQDGEEITVDYRQVVRDLIKNNGRSV